jgi:hypothetical protein
MDVIAQEHDLTTHYVSDGTQNYLFFWIFKGFFVAHLHLSKSGVIPLSPYLYSECEVKNVEAQR